MPFARSFALRLGARFDLDTDAGSIMLPEAAPTTENTAVTSPATETAPDSVAEHLARVRAALSAPPAPTEPEAAPTDDTPADAPTRDAEGRWRHADGRFASPAEEAALDAAAATAETPEPDAVDPDAPAPIVVAVRGRDGTALEIEVTDPAIADLLRANANDGLRRDEFNRRIAGVQEREVELREFEATLAADPIGVLVERLPADRQIEAALALAAQHFQTLAPHFQQWMQDQNAYRAAQLDLREMANERRGAVTTATAQARQQAAADAQERAFLDAIQSTVPASAGPRVARQYLAAADALIADAISSGEAVTPDTVDQILADTAARFFGSVPTRAPAVPASASPTPAPIAPASARPTGAPAVTVEERRARATATAARVAVAQRTRAAATAIAPAGAGAPPLAREAPPEHNTVAERIGWFKSQLTRA